MIELAENTGNYTIFKFAPDEELPREIYSEDFYSVTKTPDEISVVCRDNSNIKSGKNEKGWKCLKIKGNLDFSLVGILNSITTPLKTNGISVFVISTFNTDYFFIKENNFKKAVEILNKEKNITVINKI